MSRTRAGGAVLGLPDGDGTPAGLRLAKAMGLVPS